MNGEALLNIYNITEGDSTNQSKKSYPNWEIDFLKNVDGIQQETFQFLKNNPDVNWCYWKLSANPNITWDIVKKYPQFRWNMNTLSQNPSITWQDIIYNIDETIHAVKL